MSLLRIDKRAEIRFYPSCLSSKEAKGTKVPSDDSRNMNTVVSVTTVIKYKFISCDVQLSSNWSKRKQSAMTYPVLESKKGTF